jgi:hypothetical protein
LFTARRSSLFFSLSLSLSFSCISTVKTRDAFPMKTVKVNVRAHLPEGTLPKSTIFFFSLSLSLSLSFFLSFFLSSFSLPSAWTNPPRARKHLRACPAVSSGGDARVCLCRSGTESHPQIPEITKETKSSPL